MPSSISQISQSNSRCIVGQQTGYLRSMLRRPLYLIGAAMLTLVSILVPCPTSVAQTLQADHETIKAFFQRQDTPQKTATSVSSSRDAIRKTLLRQTLYFEQDSRGDMSSRALGRDLLIGSGGRVQFGQRGKPAVSIVLEGADPGAEPSGSGLLSGRSNYILGNDPAKWRTHVSQFNRVQVPGVYPGIDLVYYGNGEQLEHDYLVAPNADPDQIRMLFRGATPHLDAETGELVLQQPEGSEAAIRLEKPVAYQVSEDGTRRVVAANYRLHADGQAQFTLGNYDHARPLVIDPVILYGTYFGGNRDDSIVDLKLGSDGSIFLLITGDSTDLKTVGAPAKICNGTCGPTNPGNGNVKPDIYVAKLDSTGQTLLFATYLGGSDDDEALSLALDTDGSVYVAGFSHSQDFPVINGYPGGTPAVGGNPAGTLSKLSADGSTLLYSTFIGFGQPEIDSITQVGNGTAPVMVTANNGIVYLIGIATVDQTGADFIWKTNPFFTTGNDFLAKFDTTKSGTASIIYATQVGDSIGGLYSAQLSSLALDSKGDVWLYGQTSNTAFPATTAGALQPQCKSTPCSASFLMEIDPSGTSVPYATYLGGSTANGTVTPRDIVIDTSDNIYISGSTSQTDFPIVNGAITSISNGIGYASKLSPDGKTLLYSTFAQGIEIGVSSGGQLAFTGTYGPGLTLKNNLPTTPPPATGTDAIFGLIDTTQAGANSLLISSYLGTNTGFTSSHRVVISSTGQMLIAGETTATDLPVENAYQTTCASCASRTGADGFIAAIQPNDTLTLTPATLAFPSTSVGSTSAAMTATLYNGTTKSVYLAQPTLTDSTDFTQSDNCSGILSPLASCTVTFTFTPQSGGALTSTYTTGDLDTPSSPLTIALSGTGTTAAQSETLTPASIDFGTVLAGQTATQTVTFHNNGPSAVTIYNYAFSNPAFSAVGSTCTPNVAANASCTFTLQFTPTAAGPPQSSTFSIQDRSSNPTVSLTGATYINSPQVTLTPNPLRFQNQPQGQATESFLTLTNSSSFTLTFPVSQIILSDSSDFGQITGPVAGTCDFESSPNLVLAPGASCLVDIEFYAYNTADTTVTGSITLPFAPPGSAAIYAVTGNFTGTTISDAAAVVTPTNIQFPATANGKTSVAQMVTVTSSGEQPLGFISATLTGTNPTAFAVANNCPTTLNHNATCQIAVSFSPPATGNEFTGTLDVKLSSGDVDVALAGGTSPSDFILSTPTALQSNPNATWTINIAPLSTSIGFNEPITFTVTGLDPSYGTPVFTPSTVTPKSATVMTKLTFVQSPQAQLLRNSRSAIPVLACCLVCILPFRKRLKSYRSQLAVTLVVLALAMFTLTGCEASPVNFTVTATSGSISHDLSLTLQP
jgi:hypothetical protein